jgi:hypothetical protein
MHDDPDGGVEPVPRRVTAPPPAGAVHGLGPVDALRIEFQPGQLPWLAAQIDIVRYCLEDELAHQRARRSDPPSAVECPGRTDRCEVGRDVQCRTRQLRALELIGSQLPISGEAAAVADPWDTPPDDAPPGLTREGAVAIVGPAALMTVLMRGATRRVADVLAEALGHPGLDVDEHTDSSGGWRAGELPRVEPAVAERLRAIAAAAKAFADGYLNVLSHQSYCLNPAHPSAETNEPT